MLRAEVELSEYIGAAKRRRLLVLPQLFTGAAMLRGSLVSSLSLCRSFFPLSLSLSRARALSLSLLSLCSFSLSPSLSSFSLFFCTILLHYSSSIRYLSLLFLSLSLTHALSCSERERKRKRTTRAPVANTSSFRLHTLVPLMPHTLVAAGLIH